MRKVSTDGARKIFLFWGGLDLILVVFYIQGSFRQDKVPYVTDVLSIVRLLKDFDFFVMALILIGCLLHFSIILSSAAFLLKYRVAAYVGLLQMPFRLFYMLPSLSLFLMVAAYVPGLSVWTVVPFVVFSEVIKAYSLFRLLKRERSNEKYCCNV